MCAESSPRWGSRAGFSLLELLMVIVIVSVALVGVMSVFITATKGSADPMVRQQAQLIAEAYLEEILLKKFYEPDTNTVCPAAEASRSDYDNVCDYSGLSEAPKNQLGTAISGLSGYSVQVTVVRNSTVNLNGVTNPSSASVRVLRVDVTVTAPDGNSITLSGYRTDYECHPTTGTGCKSET
jgi:MSHA pilin protein MshD